MNQPQPKEMKIEIKVDEQDATGKFANFANITHSPEEFILDFLFVNPAPQAPYGKLVSRVILTPQHAKRLLSALGENLQNYERTNGEIVLSPQPAPPRNLQ